VRTGLDRVTWRNPGWTIIPLTLRAANAYVAEHHRHHKPVRGCKFSIGAVDELGALRGVAIVGRPIALEYDDGLTAEVNRTCTDGCPNANSCLYGAAWRACRAMGFMRLITYTEEGESGASLRAAGYRIVAVRAPRKSWRDSTTDPRLVAMRDIEGRAGVQRTLWEVAALTAA
jgi:hypothetical protein